MIRIFLLVLFIGPAVVLLAGCASSGVSAADMQKRQQAVAASDLLIVPGERIGPVRLGMGMDELVAKLGQPDIVIHQIVDDRWDYRSLNLMVGIDHSAAPAVNDISNVNWSDAPLLTVFKTAEGIGIGASSFDVKRVYGSPDSGDSYDMTYHSLRMRFFITDTDHSVMQISTGPY